MKFRVERDALADAVAWAARSLSTRPTMPVLAGLLLSVDEDQLSLSGFDLEASTEVDLPITGGLLLARYVVFSGSNRASQGGRT